MLTMNELFAGPVKPLVRPRNIFFDELFYDVGNLAEAELRELRLSPDREGAVIVVSPTKSPRSSIRHYENAEAMLAAEGDSIVAVAVAGVGSSIVGTASLARTVADAANGDVAGIISGYGAVDLLQEAMGGWFFYGYTDRARHYAEQLAERVAPAFPAGAAATEGGLGTTDRISDTGLPRQLDSGALSTILEAAPSKLAMLVGHSKGSLLIDYVLERFVRLQRGSKHRFYDELRVVTVSAVTALPREFKKARQVIGALDWFGGLNSIPDIVRSSDATIKPVLVQGAWHHLNTKVPLHLDLKRELAALI